MFRQRSLHMLLGVAFGAEGADQLALLAALDAEQLHHPRHLGVGHSADVQHAVGVDEPVPDRYLERALAHQVRDSSQLQPVHEKLLVAVLAPVEALGDRYLEPFAFEGLADDVLVAGREQGTGVSPAR
jgi:hypothetical protein